MSSVVRALGFFTYKLNSRPTSECDCAFYQEVDKWLFQLAGCPAHHLHDHPGRQLVHHQRRLGQSSSDGLLFSKIFHLAQLFPGDEHGQLHDVDRGQRLHEQLWSDNQLCQQLRIQSGWMGSTTEYVSIAMGYFDLLPHLLIRNAFNNPMHDGYYRSYVQQWGDHEFRRGQSHNG